jgi:hypothetical protein
VILALGLHFGIGKFMGLIVFSLFMMAMLLSYLPGAALRDRLFGPPGRPRVLKFPAGAAYQHRVAVIAAADFSDALTAEALPEGATKIEVIEDGKSVPPSNKGWQAVIELLTYLPRKLR